MENLTEIEVTEEEIKLQQLAELWIQANPRETGMYTLALLAALVKEDPPQAVRDAIVNSHGEAHSLFSELLSSMTKAIKRALEEQSGPPPYS